MLKADIYGMGVSMQGSPYTYLVYRTEFGRGILADIQEAYSGDVPDMSILLQVAWAMARTFDDAVPPYADWLRGFDPKEFALGDARAMEVIDKAASAELFRVRKTGKTKRRIARAVGRMAQRIGCAADRVLAR